MQFALEIFIFLFWNFLNHWQLFGARACVVRRLRKESVTDMRCCKYEMMRSRLNWYDVTSGGSRQAEGGSVFSAREQRSKLERGSLTQGGLFLPNLPAVSILNEVSNYPDE
mgnify:FL=1